MDQRLCRSVLLLLGWCNRIREFYESDKVVAAVCHGPAALVNVKLSDGTYLVAGQVVTGLSDAEEEVLQFTNDMPFSLETKLRGRGGEV
ncbi:hypothetical protein BO71DRAFT_430515 [Aspergillus ellipticus CBS 707.79]|uniref:DJ-1/PfpI domain-containing protein n=1 Tax=Aspergillus ellipticus CBS 707.79 TaxID=1448320 RepID=A0A319D917_9EURO|nr:hypothetical protein BO71DRAFT_430515 [Aspergillus ellipticus CBS 707.79]